MQDRPPTTRIAFADAEEGYLAIHRLRAAGFRLDVTTSMSGDIVVGVEVATERAGDVAAIARDHDGVMEGRRSDPSET